MNFAKDLVDQLKDDMTTIAAERKSIAEYSGYIDTGCYMLNAILSGSIYGGIPNNKITAFAGDPATGKTYFALSVVKHFLDSDTENLVVYYDTEAAVTATMMEERGIDTARVIINAPTTLQDFRTHCIKILKAYDSKEDKPGMMIILDSLSMLSTTKEMEDSAAGNEVRDMTKSQLIRGTFRVLTQHLAKTKVPLILTNHVYSNIGNPYAGKALSGGTGMVYAASSVLTLSKHQDKDYTKDGKEIIGNIITTKMYKSRIAKENTSADLLLTYKHGLDKYFGLLPLAEKYGIFIKGARTYELPDGRTVYRKHILENPKDVYTEEILAKLDEAARSEYIYGTDATVAGELESAIETGGDVGL